MVLILSYQYFHAIQVKYLSVTTFKECVQAGFKVLTTYPEKCVMYNKEFINIVQKKMDTAGSVAKINVKDYLNGEYIIDGQQVSFINGKGTIEANGALRQSATSLEIAGEPFLYDINADNVQDTVFLIRTSGANIQRASYYLASSISLYDGFIGTNAVFVDTALLSSAFVYKNGEIHMGYTTELATSTLKERYFVFEGDILKQLSHK